MDLYNDSIAKWLKYSDFFNVYKKYYDAECDRKPIPLDEWKKEIKCPVDHSISNSVGPSPVFHDSKYEKDMSVEIVLENGDNEFFLSLYISIIGLHLRLLHLSILRFYQVKHI